MAEKMTIDIVEIMTLLPHRYPFLLIDRVLEFELGKSITGIKNITFNEPQFMGHFPAKPVMPGVLIIEAMAQLAAILVAKSLDSTKDKEVFFMAIEDSKFRKVVQPGDIMRIYAQIEQQRGTVWKFYSKVTVDGELATESKFTAMVRSKSA
jgi:3-hydroxyacyl-[acyl-carrier-protein] dehydratase